MRAPTPYLELLQLQREANATDGARFVVIEGPDSGRGFDVVAAESVIGRLPEEVEIRLNDRFVSERHALVSRVEGSARFLITDLDSTNGTFVNEAQSQQAIELHSGNQVRVGKTILLFLGGTTTDSVEPDTNLCLPFPIAFSLRLVRASDSDPISAAWSLLRLHETIVRWLWAWAVAELRATKGRNAHFRLTLWERLSQPPSLGTWVNLLDKAISKLVLLAPEELKFGGVFLEIMRPGPDFVKPTTIFNDVVAARNELVHNPGLDAQREYKARCLVESWTDPLQNLVSRLASETVPRPLAIREIDFQSAAVAVIRYGIRWLVGDNVILPKENMTSAIRMRRGHIYLYGQAANKNEEALSLDPLVIYAACPKCGNVEPLFLDRFRDETPVYKSLTNDHLIGVESPEVANRIGWFKNQLAMMTG